MFILYFTRCCHLSGCASEKKKLINPTENKKIDLIM